ncbi:RRQRL motif-containing zinc-binding protein [Streptomyces albus]|uniref:RRQRL motif-containing zinc-binding protein n=1 Tax=Streptomyces albus TaxID=1888 RepID=UPI0033CC0D3D
MARRIVRYWDPAGERHEVPTYPWGLAPAGLATRAQLVAMGLRPRGPHVAQIRWDSRRSTTPRVAYLWPVETARPPAPRSAAQIASLGAALRARRTCPECGAVRDYCLSTRLGICTLCADDVRVAA